MKSTVFALSLLGLSSSAFAEGTPSGIAKLKGADGTDHGTVTLTQMQGVVLLQADLKDIPEGGHGFHIHETGKCSPDFKAAGEHFNPGGKGHGFKGDGPHAGDMANLFATDKGRVLAEVLNPRISLEEGREGSLFDEDGSAIILHAKPDSYGDEADAGDRIACGVITR